MRRWRSSTLRSCAPAASTSRSSGCSPANAAGEPSTTSRTAIPRSRPSRVGDRAAAAARAGGDADLGAVDAAVADQRGDDRAGRVVDRHREPEPDPGDRRVDPDDAAVAVDQRAAGVARVQRGVGLDHVLDQPRCARREPDRQRAPEAADDARRDRAAEPVRVADRDDELADAQRRRVAQLGRDQVAALGLEHGEVRQRVAADDGEAQLAAVAERRHVRPGIARRRAPT